MNLDIILAIVFYAFLIIYFFKNREKFQVQGKIFAMYKTKLGLKFMDKIAKKFNIRYVLSGTNLATEFGLPEAWIWNKLDLKNIKGIQNIFGTMKIKQFPSMSIYRWLLIRKLGLGGEFIEILNHVNYKKYKAINILKSELGWREYGDKHYESLFTKFYQAYILPEKFGIDKRKFHLSALIRNNEISRKKSLELLQMPLYNSQEFIDDKNYVLKKLGFTDSEFKVYMESPEIPHSFYPSSIEFLRFVRKIFKKVKKVGN